MRNIYQGIALFLVFFSSIQASAQVRVSIVKNGAGTSKKDNAPAIQRTIDQCAAQGGGDVIIPNGVFVTSTIFLKTGVYLHLEPDAVLTGTTDSLGYIRHIATNRKALIIADGVHHIGIKGAGTITGRGEHPNFQHSDRANGLKDRPNTISFFNCANVLLRDFTLRNGTRWCVVLKETDLVNVHNIKIISRVVANNDGLDIVDCHDVTVSDSYFDCGDDAICPKSESARGVKRVTITNCIVKSESNAIKFGAPGVGGFSDIAVSNCVLSDTRLSGIALELVDGGAMQRVRFSNIIMHRVNGSIFVKLGHRSGAQPGVLEDVFFSDILADSIGYWKPDTAAGYYKEAHDPRIGVVVAGLPNHPISGLSFHNIHLKFAGGGTLANSRLVLEDKPEVYPEYTNFGVTPAYGINIHHAEHVSLLNITVTTHSPDARPAVWLRDVSDLDLNNLHCGANFAAQHHLSISEVSNARVVNCRPQNRTGYFVRFDGQNGPIVLQSNDFSGINAISQNKLPEYVVSMHNIPATQVETE